MKKTDIALIITIASLSIIITYFLVSSLPIFSQSNLPEEVPVAERITSEIEKVDDKVFNDQAINPTVEVIVGKSAN